MKTFEEIYAEVLTDNNNAPKQHQMSETMCYELATMKFKRLNKGNRRPASIQRDKFGVTSTEWEEEILNKLDMFNLCEDDKYEIEYAIAESEWDNIETLR